MSSSRELWPIRHLISVTTWPWKETASAKLPQNIVNSLFLSIRITNNKKLSFLGNTTTASVDFFDNAFTFANNVSNVTCCHPDNSFEVATCGQGASCAGKCSAIGASLCPSGNCTDDPATCDLEFNDETSEDQGRKRSSATLSGTDLAWCTSDGCRVRKHKGCCYNPNCLRWRGRRRACKWLNYLTGNA